MLETFVVTYERVIRRAAPSKDAKILGVERKGTQVSGTVISEGGIRWLQTPMPAPHEGVDCFMMIEGSSIGLGVLLGHVKKSSSGPSGKKANSDSGGVVVTGGDSIGSIGESLWRAPLEELPRPKWAPRTGFIALCAGKASTGRRMLWVLGGGLSDAELTNDVWRSVDGGFTWDLMKSSGRRWSPRKRLGATVGSTVADPSAQSSKVQGVVYVVGGQGKAGILADVWASDTMCRTWHCMNTNAAFGPRIDVACAAVPGKPLMLVVGGGVSVDLHRDLWLSCDAGATFGLVDAPSLPRGVSFRLWPPDILCAAKAPQPGQLAVWRLRICDSSDCAQAKAELLPVDDASQDYHELELQDIPRIPRFALDLQAQVLLGWDARKSCLTVQSLAQSNQVLATRVLDVVASAGDAHVLCDMDSVFSSLRKGLLWVISEDGTSAWVSGKSRLSAQDRFVGLLGLHLHMTRGLPMEIWFGRIRAFLMPRRPAVLDVGGTCLGTASNLERNSQVD